MSIPPLQRIPAYWTRALLPLLAVLATACSTTEIQVQTTFPEPVVETLPLKVGVHYDEAFSTYAMSEEVPNRGNWNIEIGEAQLRMFRRMLPAMFDVVVEVDDPAAGDAGLDAVLVPRVDEMQFSVPYTSRRAMFEVWIRYDLALYRPDGSLIARWPLVAYGKNEDDGMMESSNAALQLAAINALRDAAAFLAIEFAQRNELRDWLVEQLATDEAQGT